MSPQTIGACVFVLARANVAMYVVCAALWLEQSRSAMPRADAYPLPLGRIASRALSRQAIPGDAWRNIIDFCHRDPSFCHLVVPKFLDNGLVLLLLAENGQKYVDRAIGTAFRQSELQAVASNPENRTDAVEEESRRLRGAHLGEGAFCVRPSCPANIAALAVS